ncbi:MAG: deoxyguanosinetriphosphate triphosphohydrolase, partial [Clostridia bacterium]|nr:deoxyguanosinetriphosphate triphosphohydrolase [Clostridia bacterium]
EALVLASIRNGVKNGIGVEEPYGSAMKELHAFMFDRVYTSPVAKSEDHKVTGVIEFLFEHFSAHPEEIAPEYRKNIESDGIQRAVADYIAGMTDRYAIGCFESLFVPKVWSYK